MYAVSSSFVRGFGDLLGKGRGPRLATAGGMLISASFNSVTSQILSAAIDVHRTLGPGLLESIYVPCLQIELTERKLRFVSQRAIPIVYKGISLEMGYRVDLIVEDAVVVEVKAVSGLAEVHKAQALTYMRLLNCPVGLVINFNVPRLMDGVKRVINPRMVSRDDPGPGSGEPPS